MFLSRSFAAFISKMYVFIQLDNEIYIKFLEMKDEKRFWKETYRKKYMRIILEQGDEQMLDFEPF